MISVVIPTFNRANTIKRAVMSVLNQSYRDLEVIVVDDGSTDDTENVLLSIDDKRLIYIYKNHENGNVARNLGIRYAQGDYIALLDSDDEWRPSKLEKQLTKMEKNNADISFHDNLQHSLNNGETRLCNSVNNAIEGFIPYDIQVRDAIFPITLMARRHIFEKVCFDESLKRMQGYEWEIQAGLYGRFYYIPEVLSDSYLQDDSITVGGSEKLEIAANYILEKHIKLCEDHENIKEYLLKIIIGCRIRQGKPVEKECLDLLRVKRTITNLARCFLAYTHLIYPLNRFVD